MSCCSHPRRLLILPMLAKRPTATTANRPLRACVVQTAVPASGDFHQTDLALDGPAIRRKHCNHLSAALAAVERMLALRETHKGREGRLDWLILPELAVHPKDVRTHLVPFARAHKAIILTGLTCEEILAGQPLVNSALWVIPEWSDTYGLQNSRQVFHTYGQPQASIAFLEIDHIGELLDRREVSGASANKWKYPPAGLNMTSPGGSS